MLLLGHWSPWCSGNYGSAAAADFSVYYEVFIMIQSNLVSNDSFYASQSQLCLVFEHHLCGILFNLYYIWFLNVLDGICRMMVQ